VQWIIIVLPHFSAILSVVFGFLEPECLASPIEKKSFQFVCFVGLFFFFDTAANIFIMKRTMKTQTTLEKINSLTTNHLDFVSKL